MSWSVTIWSFKVMISHRWSLGCHADFFSQPLYFCRISPFTFSFPYRIPQRKLLSLLNQLLKAHIRFDSLHERRLPHVTHGSCRLVATPQEIKLMWQLIVMINFWFWLPHICWLGFWNRTHRKKRLSICDALTRHNLLSICRKEPANLIFVGQFGEVNIWVRY